MIRFRYRLDPLIEGLQNGCHIWRQEYQLNLPNLGITVKNRTVVQKEAHLAVPADQVLVPFLKPALEDVAIKMVGQRQIREALKTHLGGFFY